MRALVIALVVATSAGFPKHYDASRPDAAPNPFDAPRPGDGPAAAAGNPVVYGAGAAAARTHAERVALRRRAWKENRTRTHDARAQTHAESSTCYAKNYPDLFYHFCRKGCNVDGLHTHFPNHGRKEGRQFGCVIITAAEKARWAAQAARLEALDSRSHHTHGGAILGIGGGPRNHMLGGPGAGLNNAKDGFFALCQRGRNISYPTLMWNARVPNTPPFPSIPHETLWDVDHWNAYVAKHGGLPYLVADKPTSIVGTPRFANRLWLNMFRGPMQNPHGSLKVAHFHRALRPHPLIL